ncbi:uncharacterized protein LOC143181157 [Calliopsis andreniformis]|uniref:uncharacterized protein LOC143181157 n=1 Tax=Calliopsis andreniformis TaxID=337506 RepID=UPI003FCE3E59
MPSQFCFLCASDEGVFLDITTDNKQVFHKQFETCSLVKVPTVDQLPTKLCHKCVYELNQCSIFVERYKDTIKERTTKRKQCCSLCFESPKKEYIFDLHKDKNSKHSSFDKIQKAFSNDIEEDDYKFICLSCRYKVDVLLDLKNVSQEIATKLNDVITEGIDYSTFPKIKTAVVSRKTTTTESAKIISNTSEDSDHTSGKMTRTRSQKNKVSSKQLSAKQSKPQNNKSQTCDECNTLIEADKDTHKVRKTGKTICKSCWSKINKVEEVEKQQNITETRSCKVFLKDVLKDTALKEQKLQKVEEKVQTKKPQAVKETNSTEESKSRKAVSDTEVSVTRQGQKRPIRSARSENIQAKDKLSKKLKTIAKSDDTDSKQSDPKTEVSLDKKEGAPVLRSRDRKATTVTTSQTSDSDPVKINDGRATRSKRTIESSLSDADIDGKRNRSKLKTILAGNTALKNISISEESSSNEEPVQKKKIRFSSASPVTIDLTAVKGSDTDSSSKSGSRRKRLARKVSKSPVESKPSPKLQSPEPDDKDSVEEESKVYTCKECQITYANKLLGLTHELTHYKQLQLELERVVIESATKETSESNETADDQSEDQSETIAIRVDDDEDETMPEASTSNENERVTISSEKEDKVPSEKDIGEELVDVELVIKETDDDQSQEVEKEAKEQDAEAKEVEVKEAEAKEAEAEEVEAKETEAKEVEAEETEALEVEAKEAEAKEMEAKEVEAKEAEAKEVEAKEAEAKEAEAKEAEAKEAEAKEAEAKEPQKVESPKQVAKSPGRRGRPRKSSSRKYSTKRGKRKSDKVDDGSAGEAAEESTAKSDENEDISLSQTEDVEKEEKAEEKKKGKEKEKKEKEKSVDKEKGENEEKVEEEEKVDEKKKRTEEETVDEVEKRLGKETVEEEEKTEEKHEDEEEKREKEAEEETRVQEADKETEENTEEKESESKEETICVEEISESVDKEHANKSQSSKDTSSVIEIEDVDEHKSNEQNETEQKDVEIEMEVIANNDKEDVMEITAIETVEDVECCDNNDTQISQVNGDNSMESEPVVEEVDLAEDVDHGKDGVEVIEEDACKLNTSKRKQSTSDSANVAAEVLQEVLDLASAEVQNRQDVADAAADSEAAEAETLENISREIQNSVDMPSLKIDSTTVGNENDSD